MNEMEIIEFENLPSNKTPINSFNLNKLQTNAKEAIKNRKPTIELLTVSSAAPTECNIGDKYYNTTTSKIYTATATNTWGTEGENPTSLYLYVDLEHKELYYFNGTTFVSYGGGSGGAGGDTLPIGAILPFSSDTIPNGWLLCDGSSFSATSYPELFDVIGVTYGWDADRNPKLPDLRGRVAVGKKDATSADDTEFSSLGKIGGEKTHTLTKSELPKIDIQTKFASSSGGDGSGLVYGTSTGSSPNNLVYNVNYGSQAHNNLQPYIVTNFIIKAKMTVAIEGEIIQEDGTASETNVYSSVAVDNKLKDIYSTEEVKTNKIWINGKPIYRKIFKFIADSHNYIYTHNTPNVEFITNVYGMTGGYPIPYSSITDTYIIEIWAEPTRFGIKSGTSINLDRTYYITLEYTKTTD